MKPGGLPVGAMQRRINDLTKPSNNERSRSGDLAKSVEPIGLADRPPWHQRRWLAVPGRAANRGQAVAGADRLSDIHRHARRPMCRPGRSGWIRHRGQQRVDLPLCPRQRLADLPAGRIRPSAGTPARPETAMTIRRSTAPISHSHQSDACRQPPTRLCGGAKVAERLTRPWISTLPNRHPRLPPRHG
jgi:hypothetical protein